MKSKMTKRVGVNNGMPCIDTVCKKPSYVGEYCYTCGWHAKYHGSAVSPAKKYSSDAADVVDIAADVGGIIGAAMDIFSSDSSGGGSYDGGSLYDGGSSDDSGPSDDYSSNDSDNSGGGGGFDGGGSNGDW